MAVTEADVRKIAELARLSLEDTAVLTLTAELNGILAHMDVLQQVDTSSVVPTAGIGADGAPLRGDRAANLGSLRLRGRGWRACRRDPPGRPSR